jgi:hypothetical protein
MRLVAGVLIGVLLCASDSIAQTSPQGRGATPATPAKPTTPAAPAAAAKKSPGAGPVIVVETMKGTFEFETYPNEAPKTVEHIVALVKNRFYNGQRFHRVEPGFVVQFGDPQSRDPNKRDDLGHRRQRQSDWRAGSEQEAHARDGSRCHGAQRRRSEGRR